MCRVILFVVGLLGIACSGGQETGSSYTDEEVAWLRVGGAPDGRTTAQECDDYRAPGLVWDADEDGVHDEEHGNFGQVNCLSDSDCSEGLNGRCVSDPAGYELFCSYDECLTDEDCDASAVCACGGDVERNDCVPSTCTVDADCGVGALCVQDTFACHSGGYHCMRPDAECIRDEDCPDDDGSDDSQSSGDCSYNTGDGLWECTINGCED